jgi:hypothetical protein
VYGQKDQDKEQKCKRNNYYKERRAYSIFPLLGKQKLISRALKIAIFVETKKRRQKK